MKVCDITVATVKEYLRIPDSDEDSMLETILAAAKAFVKGYTGLTDEQIDTYEDISIAIFVLCADMYENRLLTINNDKVNRAVQTILDMHCRNLL